MSPLATYILTSVVGLAVFALLGVAVIALARRAGIGRSTGPLSLAGRLPLDGRRVVYLIRACDVVYVVVVSEAGTEKLGELPASEVPEPSEQPSGALLALLGRARVGHKPSTGGPA